MAVQVKTFTANLETLGADSYTYTTDFAADFQIGQITIAAGSVGVKDIPNNAQTPLFKGIQETASIWLDSSAGEDYDCLLAPISWNGRRYLVWAPEGGASFFVNNGSELRIVVTNKHAFGQIFGTVTVNTI